MDCRRVQHRRQGRPNGQNSLSESEILGQGTPSDVPSRGIGVEREACSVRKDSVVDVSVLYYGSRVVPFAVDDEANTQQGRSGEEGLERGDGGGHHIASDWYG